jgi:hypothetical protein
LIAPRAISKIQTFRPKLQGTAVGFAAEELIQSFCEQSPVGIIRGRLTTSSTREISNHWMSQGFELLIVSIRIELRASRRLMGVLLAAQFWAS